MTNSTLQKTYSLSFILLLLPIVGFSQFAPPEMLFPSGDPVEYLESEDLDGDGDMDILGATCSDPDFVFWLENMGASGFAEPEILIEGLDCIWPIAFGDIDGNGHTDMVIGENADYVKVYLNQGNETFVLSATLTSEAHAIVTLDYDNDGDLDILTGKDDGLYWHMQWLPGQFFTEQPIFSYSEEILQIETVDIDLDGLKDVVLSLIHI